MKTKNFLASLFVLSSITLAAASTHQISGEASGAPGIQGSWSSAKKVQVGTYNEDGRSANSPLWFTLAEGTLTEVYYPTIDQGQVKDSQFLVSDGRTFFQQERDLKHKVEVLSPSLVKITNQDFSGRYKISHTFYTLKDSATLVDEVEVQTNINGIHIYLLTNPQLNNTAAKDSAAVTNDGFLFSENRTQLSVSTSAGFRQKSVGFVGSSDGYQDISRHYQMNNLFTTATNGNVASTGEIEIPQTAGTYHFYVTYSFGDLVKLKAKKLTDYNQAKNDYVLSWTNYLNTLKVPKNLSAPQLLLYLRSLYTLRCHEDKLNPGAFIASLSIPWGESQKESPNQEIGGYHLIWPRDLFNVSVALLNSGDYPAALRALRFLKKIQYKEGAGTWNLNPRIIPKAGAWPQNTWVTGRTYWEGFQLDQTAFPIHLFYHILLKTPTADRGALIAEFQPMLTSALNFISTYGPWTHQERWEENFGISPSSFSAATAALIIGSKIYPSTAYGQYMLDTANHWLYTPNDNIDTWTFTTNGSYGDGRYYLRMAGGSSYDANWNPNDNSSIHIANSSQSIPQGKVLDQGFLQLVLLGLKPGNSPEVKASKAILDRQISYVSPKGRGWYRYSFDAYGEEGKGRLWPLLSGEHARFAIERFSANDLSWNDVLKETNTIVDSFLGFANSGLMIPEQVFENSGEGTGSATPLAWSHAEYIKLLWSVENKKNIENVLK
ncbi:MAG: glycoside hydrolase family 15 protein [Bacteriovorax sp.]|nr:glycoside hydrolase family 15 protein [Bacteriovorax sp.]